MRKDILIASFLLIVLVIAAAYYLINRTRQTANTAPGKVNSTACRFSSEAGRDGALMVLIPAGDFFMGNPGGDELYYDEIPCQRSTLFDSLDRSGSCVRKVSPAQRAPCISCRFLLPFGRHGENADMLLSHRRAYGNPTGYPPYTQ